MTATTRRGLFGLIVGAVAATKLKTAPDPIVYGIEREPWPVLDYVTVRASEVDIEWPIRLRTYSFGVYADEVLTH